MDLRSCWTKTDLGVIRWALCGEAGDSTASERSQHPTLLSSLSLPHLSSSQHLPSCNLSRPTPPAYRTCLSNIDFCTKIQQNKLYKRQKETELFGQGPQSLHALSLS